MVGQWAGQHSKTKVRCSQPQIQPDQVLPASVFVSQCYRGLLLWIFRDSPSQCISAEQTAQASFQREARRRSPPAPDWPCPPLGAPCPPGRGSCGWSPPSGIEYIKRQKTRQWPIGPESGTESLPAGNACKSSTSFSRSPLSRLHICHTGICNHPGGIEKSNPVQRPFLFYEKPELFWTLFQPFLAPLDWDFLSSVSQVQQILLYRTLLSSLKIGMNARMVRSTV